jgi:hypothetical protein
LIESGKFSEQDIENITEILGAALGGIAGHTMLAPALAKGGAAAALTKAGVGPGIAKALTGKTASAALGSAAGEVLDPTKKQKDKNPVSAAAGGAAGSATAGALGLGASYQPKGESLSEDDRTGSVKAGPLNIPTQATLGDNQSKKNYGKQFSFKLPGPLRNVQLDLPGSHSQTVKNGQKYAGTATKAGLSKKGEVALQGGIDKVGKVLNHPAAKAGLVGAAALGTKAVVDTLMGHGKNSNGKNSNEEFEFANKLIESGLFSEEEIIEIINQDQQGD